MLQHYPTFAKVLIPVTQLTEMIQIFCYKIILLLHFYLTIKQSSTFGNIYTKLLILDNLVRDVSNVTKSPKTCLF